MCGYGLCSMCSRVSAMRYGNWDLHPGDLLRFDSQSLEDAHSPVIESQPIDSLIRRRWSLQVVSLPAPIAGLIDNHHIAEVR